MTTTVKQGSGRPAAAQRSARHAQTTPLPPKTEGVVSNADGTINYVASPSATKYGMMTIPQLKDECQARGLPISSRPKKGDLLNLLLAAEQAEAAQKASQAEARAAAKAKATLTTSKTDAKIEAALPVETDGKSTEKARAFLAAAESLGWAPVVGGKTEDGVSIIVGRGQERIQIQWVAGAFTGEAYYSHPARTTLKLRNASHAKKIMAIPASQADEEAQKVSAQKASRPTRKSAAESATAGRKALPFDVTTATDEEVLQALHGKRISWTNEISGEVEASRLPASGATIRPGKSGRSIDFLDPSGFRSVRVSSIISVR